jgi:C1A family cysteine protease
MSDEQHVGGLGRVYIPDPRDRSFAMRSAIRATGPIGSKTWRLGPVLDQGWTSQCVAYAWLHFLASAPIMTRSRTFPSPVDLYKAAQKIDEWPGEDYDGTSVRAGAKVLQSLGLISGYLWADSMDTLKRFVVQRGPVVIGTDWFSGMDRTRGGYTIPEGRHRGGHAYLVHGWSASRKAFRAVNSWGAEWGDGGKLWIDELDMQYLIFQANGEACSALEVE